MAGPPTHPVGWRPFESHRVARTAAAPRSPATIQPAQRESQRSGRPASAGVGTAITIRSCSTLFRQASHRRRLLCDAPRPSLTRAAPQGYAAPLGSPNPAVHACTRSPPAERVEHRRGAGILAKVLEEWIVFGLEMGHPLPSVHRSPSPSRSDLPADKSPLHSRLGRGLPIGRLCTDPPSPSGTLDFRSRARSRGAHRPG